MNCKPGDLAIVVQDFENPENVGALVRVVSRADPNDYDSDIDWDCDALSVISGPRSFTGEWFTAVPGSSDSEFGYRDCELRPLRDPGDDATDETLLWLPSPTREKESA
jgi:hypothetical protein